jgi:hypothetical protein
VPVSKLGQDIDYQDWDFLSFLSSWRQMSKQYFELGHDHFLAHPVQLIIVYGPVIRGRESWGTVRAVKLSTNSKLCSEFYQRIRSNGSRMPILPPALQMSALQLVTADMMSAAAGVKIVLCFLMNLTSSCYVTSFVAWGPHSVGSSRVKLRFSDRHRGTKVTWTDSI